MEFQKLWVKTKQRLCHFYAFTGRDTVLSFHRVGKNKSWETWKVLSSLTKTFQELANCPDLLSFAMDEVERFDVILCSTTIECKFVNEAKNKLFAGGFMGIEEKED